MRGTKGHFPTATSRKWLLNMTERRKSKLVVEDKGLCSQLNDARGSGKSWGQEEVEGPGLIL